MAKTLRPVPPFRASLFDLAYSRLRTLILICRYRFHSQRDKNCRSKRNRLITSNNSLRNNLNHIPRVCVGFCGQDSGRRPILRRGDTTLRPSIFPFTLYFSIPPTPLRSDSHSRHQAVSSDQRFHQRLSDQTPPNKQSTAPPFPTDSLFLPTQAISLFSAEDCSPQLLSRELPWKSKMMGPRDWRKRNRFFWFAFTPSVFFFSVEFSLVAVLVLVSGCIVGRVNVTSSAIRETVLCFEQIRYISEEFEWERL